MAKRVDPRNFVKNFAMVPPTAEDQGIMQDGQMPGDADQAPDAPFEDAETQPEEPPSLFSTPGQLPPNAVERSQRPQTENRNRRTGKPFPFALAHGTGGASIWWGMLAYGIGQAVITRVDGKVTAITQPEIPPTTYMAAGNLDADTRLQSHLGWYGDVYAYWEADESAVTLFEIRGPDQPEGQNIGELDADLNRETTTGKYYVKIGSVPENGTVDQQISSDIAWFPVIFTGGSSGSTGSEGSEGSTGSSAGSSTGDGSLGSDKSTAIVPASFYSTGYTALFTLEAPDVRFEDVISIRPRRRKMNCRIDPKFVEVCEKDSLAVVSACPSSPAQVGAAVEGGTIKLQIIARKLPETVTLKISGIRRGFAGMRFPTRTEAQFKANERFLNSAYPRK